DQRGLIIPMIIQTIGLGPSRADGTDGAPHVSRQDRSGADQADANHQPTDRAVGGSNPSRRAASMQRFRSSESRILVEDDANTDEVRGSATGLLPNGAANPR